MKREPSRIRSFIRLLSDRLLTSRVAALILLLLGIVVLVLGFLFLYSSEARTFEQFVSDLYANGGAELLSIAVTVLVIDGLNQRRAAKQEKAALILQMGSPDNAFAIEALRQLHARDWVRDGSLKGAHLNLADLHGARMPSIDLQKANLWKANLEGVFLFSAVLEETDLHEANLKGAHMSFVHLQGANLENANLSGAELDHAHLGKANLHGVNLRSADLHKAILFDANLKEAILHGANLQEAALFDTCLESADLGGANMQGANLNQVILDKNTILPDGTKWTEDSDMRKFTHPEEWQAEQKAESEANK